MDALRKTTLALCILASLAAVHQAHAEWGIGPLGGANLANAEVDGHSTSSVTGWALGARLEMGMMPILSLMFDPMLVQSGAQFDNSGAPVDGRGKFVAMEVPMLLNAKVKLMNVGVYGFMGPDLVINTDAGGNVSRQNDLGQGDLAPVGLAGQVGAGVAMGVAPFIDVTADARYSHGFTDLLDGAKGDVEHWKSRDVRLNLGVLLHTDHWRNLRTGGSAYQSR
ncbi:MAG: hypothetical protein JWP91_4430 [Fibrobacteres bacterium]|nr:hypothetical protein [Fibrobacterota bacterium]